MTINERVSDTQIDRMIDRVGSVIHVRKSLTGSGECGVVEVNAELFLDVLRELQQYRAAAEPVCPKCRGTGMADSGGIYPWGEPILIECDCHAAPQVTSVPEELLSAMEDVLRISDRDHDAWNRAKYAIAAIRSAPAVQAEQLSGNTEQVSQPYTLPEPITRNDADGWWMYKGRRVGGGCAEWYNRALGDCRAAIASGNSPAIPDGYALVPVEPTDLMVEAMYRHPLSMRGALKAAIEAAPKQK